VTAATRNVLLLAAAALAGGFMLAIYTFICVAFPIWALVRCG
jgi:hypothetical protein